MRSSPVWALIFICAQIARAGVLDTEPSSWTTVAVDPVSLTLDDDRGRYLDLAIDPGTSRAYVALYDENNGNLRLASYVGSGGDCGGGVWDCEDLDVSGDVGRYPSIDLYSAALTWKLGIAYEDVSNGDLKFYERVWSGFPLPGSWSARTVVIDSAVPGESSRGRFASLRYDSSGVPRIAAQTCDEYFVTCAVRYIRETGSGGNCGEDTVADEWQCDDIDDGLNVGSHISFDLDGDDTPYIAYFGGRYNDLSVAEEVGEGSGNCGPRTRWLCTTVDDTEGTTGRSASLDAWGSGVLHQVHVAYHSQTSSTEASLKYARYVGSGGSCAGGSWECSEIEETGSDDSMGLDLVAKLSTTAIAYMGSGDLRIAIAESPGNCGPLVFQDGVGWVPSWRCETLVAGSTSMLPGEGAALKIDGYGEPFVAYSQGQILTGSRGLRVAYPWVARDGFESGDTSGWSAVTGGE